MLGEIRRILRPGGYAVVGEGWILNDLYNTAIKLADMKSREEMAARYSLEGAEELKSNAVKSGISDSLIIRDESGGVWLLFRK